MKIRTAVFLVMLLALLVLSASAEESQDWDCPVGGFEDGVGLGELTARGDTVSFQTADELTTGHTVTFSIGIPEGKTATSVTLMRRPDWDTKYYSLYRNDTLDFSCEFYRPGSYCFRVYLDDEKGAFYTGRFEVTGTDLVAQKAAEIAEQCPAGDDYTRALWLHDWLATHTYYDASQHNFDAGVLLYEGYGVCYSYTEAYAALLKQVNIESAPVPATAMSHIWNAVRLDGEWYMADLTWDRTGRGEPGEGSPSETCRHIYFALPESLLSYDHYEYTDRWGCSAVADNYFMRNGDGEKVFGCLEEDISACIEEGPGTAELDVRAAVDANDVLEKADGKAIRYDIAAELIAVRLNDTERTSGETKLHLLAAHQASTAAKAEKHMYSTVKLNTVPVAGKALETVSWAYGSGVLTFSGEGSLPDYAGGTSPWSLYLSDWVTLAVLEEGITAVGAGAFQNCAKLSEITVPESVETIAEDAFDGCTALSRAQVVCGTEGLVFAQKKNLSYAATGVHRADPDGNCTVCGAFFSENGPAVLSLPSSLETLKAGALSGTAAGIIVLPDDCEEAENGAVQNCGNLRKVFLPKALGEKLLSGNRLEQVICAEEGQVLDIVLLGY